MQKSDEVKAKVEPVSSTATKRHPVSQDMPDQHDLKGDVKSQVHPARTVERASARTISLNEQ